MRTSNFGGTSLSTASSSTCETSEVQIVDKALDRYENLLLHPAKIPLDAASKIWNKKPKQSLSNSENKQRVSDSGGVRPQVVSAQKGSALPETVLYWRTLMEKGARTQTSSDAIFPPKAILPEQKLEKIVAKAPPLPCPPSAPPRSPPPSTPGVSVQEKGTKKANFTQVEPFEAVLSDEKPASVPPPKTLREAKLSPWWPQYKKAAEVEFTGLEKNGTWELCPISKVPKGKNILRGKFVFDDKRGQDGNMLRFKGVLLRWVLPKKKAWISSKLTLGL